MIETLLLAAYRDSAATTASLAIGLVVLTAANGSTSGVMLVQLNTNVVGAIDRHPPPGVFTMGAGDNLSAYTLDASVGGSITWYVSVKRTEFDAS